MHIMKLESNNTKNKPARYYVSGGLVAGAAVSVLLGGIFSLPFGAAIGLLIGASLDRWASKNAIREWVDAGKEIK